MQSKDIWIFVEFRKHEVMPVTFEMFSEFRKISKELNGKTCACLIGSNVGEYIPLLKNQGVDRIYVSENSVLSDYSLEAYVYTLQKLIEKYWPLTLVFSATPFGGELAPRVAARLRLPCITEVKRIKVQGENLSIAKSCYEEKVYQNFNFRPERTVVVTVLPGDMESEGANVSGEMEVVNEVIHLEPDMIRTRNIKFIRGDPRKIRLEEADLIVAGGKGIGQDLAILEDLADILEASIGGTRPLVDDGIIPWERQIGITGRSVAPKLLIACGISGAREFIAGTEKSKLTIAINKDARAPIFKFANLGIIGDLKKIVPLLIHQVRVLKQKAKKENGSSSPI